MAIWEAIFLGIIQGITEFLPISSTAHLLVARQLLGHKHPEDAFTIVIQLGTLAAVYVYFRKDIGKYVQAVWEDTKLLEIASTTESRLAWLIILGSIPAGLVGLFFKKWLKTNFYNVLAMAVVAIVFALLMGLAEWWGRRRVALGQQIKTADEQLSIGDALWIGAWQALALMPGGSRSGTTITGALFAGLSRATATRFSFLLSLPIITAAGLKELYDEYKKYQNPMAGEPESLFASGDQIIAMLIGTVVSGLVGYVAIAWLLRFLEKYSTSCFVFYRLLLGIVLLAALGLGWDGRSPLQLPEMIEKPTTQPSLNTITANDSGNYITVKGRVLWPRIKAIPKPQRVPLDRIAALTEPCSMPTIPTYEDMLVEPNSRGVKNVMVWLRNDSVDRGSGTLLERMPSKLSHAEAKTHVINIEGCQFRPRCLVARVGDRLRVENHGSIEHRLLVDGQNVKEMKRPVLFESEVMNLRRDPLAIASGQHTWMKGWVRVFDHPYSTVTDELGFFVLSEVPAGRWRIVIWHELGYHGGTGVDGQVINIAGDQPEISITDVELDIPGQ